MLAEMTAQEFCEWLAYYERNPWGPARDDIRQDVFRRRLLVSLFGDGSQEVPAAVWPYFAPTLSEAEILERVNALEEQLEDNGAGGYRWKTPPGETPT